MTRVVVRPEAERDIFHIVDWYLENAPAQAERFTDDLRATIGHIHESPRLFRAVYGDVRRAALRTFPYFVWLVCFDEADVVHILGVSHQRQDPETVRRRIL